SPAILDVVLVAPPESNTVTVEYAVTGGTADGNGVDYNLSPGVLTFDPCVTNRTIDIIIVNDGAVEEDETIQVTLFNPVDADLGANAQHTYTILSGRCGPGCECTAHIHNPGPQPARRL
ncbi:MAG: Calx-beta domain-containing protein, partial [Planctomycetota bacterium]